MMKTSNTLNNTGEVITKKDLRRLFFDSLSVSASLNYEKQMDMGCAFSLAPILQKLYKNKEDLSEALKRHTEFYNVTPMFNPTLLGVLTAMEERNAKDEDFHKESINATKASLMGPMSGIGDTIDKGTLKTIATGVGCTFALQGSFLGPILFMLIYGVSNLLIRYFGVFYGYKFGVSLFQNSSEIIKKIFSAVTVIGLMVVGGMTASIVSINLQLAIGVGEGIVNIMDILNAIMPDILSLGIFALVYWLLKKGTKATTILFGIIVVSIVGSAAGIF